MRTRQVYFLVLLVLLGSCFSVPLGDYKEYYRQKSEAIVFIVGKYGGYEQEAFRIYHEHPEDYEKFKAETLKKVLLDDQTERVSEQELDKAARSNVILMTFGVNFSDDDFDPASETLRLLSNAPILQPPVGLTVPRKIKNAIGIEGVDMVIRLNEPIVAKGLSVARYKEVRESRHGNRWVITGEYRVQGIVKEQDSYVYLLQVNWWELCRFDTQSYRIWGCPLRSESAPASFAK